MDPRSWGVWVGPVVAMRFAVCGVTKTNKQTSRLPHSLPATHQKGAGGNKKGVNEAKSENNSARPPREEPPKSRRGVCTPLVTEADLFYKPNLARARWCSYVVNGVSSSRM